MFISNGKYLANIVVRLEYRNKYSLYILTREENNWQSVRKTL